MVVVVDYDDDHHYVRPLFRTPIITYVRTVLLPACSYFLMLLTTEIAAAPVSAYVAVAPAVFLALANK